MSPTTQPDGPPTRCDLLITGAAVLDPTVNDPGALTHRRSIAIAGDTIIEVGPSDDLDTQYDSLRTIDAAGHVVTPGFVDAHVHLGAFLGAARPYTRPSEPSPYGGAGDERTALRTVAQLCSMPVPDDLVATVVKPVLAAMVRCGFIAVVDAGGPGPGGVFAAAELVGIRAAVGPSFADRWHDESGVLDTRADTDQLLADAAAFLHRHTNRTPNVVPLASAVETLGCSDALLEGLAALAAEYDTPLHIHSHIGEHDRNHSLDAYRAGPTERLLRTGMLTERTTIMHAGHLTDDDIAQFAATGVTVNHNPVGNALYGFGVAAPRAVPRLLEAGVPIVLGSDWTPSIPTPFDLIRAALMLHRDAAANDLALSLEDALTMATNSGVALGQPGRLGAIAGGQLADLVIIDINGTHHLASTHPTPAIALHARPTDVTTVIVGGTVVVDDRTLVTADEHALLAEANAALSQLG